MSQARKNAGKSKAGKSNKNGIYTSISILVAIVAILIVIKVMAEVGDKGGAAVSRKGGDVVITKSLITEKATFIPYKSGGTDMEIFAVMAPDGTIRTALNTCQVCYDSDRGYYVQEASEMVCQNCGNRFLVSQIEKERNGCNPVPILEDSKTDDGEVVTISASYLDQYAVYFKDWKS